MGIAGRPLDKTRLARGMASTRCAWYPAAHAAAQPLLSTRGSGAWSWCQSVEAQQSRVDREDFQVAEAGFQGVPAQRGGAQHGSGRGGIPVAPDRWQAFDHPPGIVVLLLDGSGGRELVLHQLVGNKHLAPFPD